MNTLAGIPMPEVEEAVAAVHDHAIERVVIIGGDGDIIWLGHGNESKVGVPSEITGDAIIVHNHPNNALLFSYDDIASMLKNDERACIAVCGDAWIAMYRNPTDRWQRTPLSELLMSEWSEKGNVPSMYVLASCLGGKVHIGSTANLPSVDLDTYWQTNHQE